MLKSLGDPTCLLLVALTAQEFVELFGFWCCRFPKSAPALSEAGHWRVCFGS